MNLQLWHVSVCFVFILQNFTTISMTITSNSDKSKREKIVRITIEHVDVPNTQQSIADIKRAPALQKQILLLKEKESVRKQDEQKKKIESKILSRLSNLLAKVKDIKQRHFHHHGDSEVDDKEGQEVIPSAAKVVHHHPHHKSHHHKHQSPVATRKTYHHGERPALHLPNEGMDSGDNVDINITETSGIADENSLRTIENEEQYGDQLNRFQNGIKESTTSKNIGNLPATNLTKSTSSDILYTINKGNKSVSDGSKSKQSNDENSYKILVKDYELSSGNDDSDEDEDITFKKPTMDQKLVGKNLTHSTSDSQFFANTSASIGKTNVNVTSQEDFEVVNSNELSQQKQYDTQSADVSRIQRPDDSEQISKHQGDSHEIGFKIPESKIDFVIQPKPDLHSGDKGNTFDPTTRHLGDNNDKINVQIASTRYMGDKNDWGNGTPMISSEDIHYWDKEKKTKANINNVNHKMKDFSSNFFTATMRHDQEDKANDEDDFEEKVDNKNRTSLEHDTEDASSEKKNSTVVSLEENNSNEKFSNNSMLNLNRKTNSTMIEKGSNVQNLQNNKTLDLEDNKKLKNEEENFTNISKNNTLLQSETLSNATFGDSGVVRDSSMINSSRNVESANRSNLSSNESLSKDIFDGNIERESKQKQDQIQLVVESEPGSASKIPQNVNIGPHSGLQIAKINITKIKEMDKLQKNITAEFLNKNSASLTQSNNTQQDFKKRLKSRLQLMSEKRQLFNRTAKMADENARLIVVTPTKLNENAHSREIDEFCSMKVTASYADPNDCSKYWLCAGGKKYETHCPGDLVYNNVISSCDDPKSSKNQ
eukprot:TCONS_00072148-protein